LSKIFGLKALNYVPKTVEYWVVIAMPSAASE
jgi:hypothetical protein